MLHSVGCEGLKNFPWMIISLGDVISPQVIQLCPSPGSNLYNFTTTSDRDWVACSTDRHVLTVRQGAATAGMRVTVGMERDSHWHAGDSVKPLFLYIRKSLAISSSGLGRVFCSVTDSAGFKHLCTRRVQAQQLCLLVVFLNFSL